MRVLWLTVALAAPILLSVPPGLPGAEPDRRTAGSGKAERPRAYLETTYSVPAGRTLAVPSGGDAAVGFAGYERGDYRLAVKSPFHGAGSDGADPGVDPDRLPGARVASMPAAAERRGRR